MVNFRSLINSSLAIMIASRTVTTANAFFRPKAFIFSSFQMITSPLTSSSSSSSSNATSTSTSAPNKLQQIQQLSNQYYALRHGQSKANIANIISSDPSISTVEHGLTDLGRDQVYNSACLFCKEYHNDDDNINNNTTVAIYASDFTRARETALIFAQVLMENNVPVVVLLNNEGSDDGDSRSGVKLEKRLRERYFGQFNGESDSHYQDVWDEDCINPNHTKYGVESVNSVVKRTTELILDIEKSKKSKNCNLNVNGNGRCKVILVAHGDVLQILQTAFLNVDGSIHRSLDHLETASVRELILKK